MAVVACRLRHSLILEEGGPVPQGGRRLRGGCRGSCPASGLTSNLYLHHFLHLLSLLTLGKKGDNSLHLKRVNEL